MRFISSLIIVAASLPASVAIAAPPSDQLVAGDRQPALVDRLFPETEIEGEGWRGLLKIMLMNQDLEVRRRVMRSERDPDVLPAR